MTEILTETKPILEDPPAQWPPVVHIYDKRYSDAKIAICGEKLMGLKLDNAYNVCKKCLEIFKRECS